MSEQHITQVSADELHKLPDETDLEYLRNMTEAEIEQNARDDPDNPPATPEELAQAKHIPPEQQQE